MFVRDALWRSCTKLSWQYVAPETGENLENHEIPRKSRNSTKSEHVWWDAGSAISAKKFWHFPMSPHSTSWISALRRSWKEFLGSRSASVSSTFRKTKRLVVLATWGKVISKCQKNHHSAEIIVFTSRISPVELLSRSRSTLLTQHRL